MREIAAKEGFGELYHGLSAGLLRQATYTTARLGIFNVISTRAKEANGGANLPLWQKAACGLTAGGLGALVGTPADLTLVRMQADSTLPVESRRNYKVGGCCACVVCVVWACGCACGCSSPTRKKRNKPSAPALPPRFARKKKKRAAHATPARPLLPNPPKTPTPKTPHTHTPHTTHTHPTTSKGVADAMVRIVREDGVTGLFKGGGPTVVRAMALNMGMLASNDQVRVCACMCGGGVGGLCGVVCARKR